MGEMRASRWERPYLLVIILLTVAACEGTHLLGSLEESDFAERYFAADCTLRSLCDYETFNAAFPSVAACVTAAMKNAGNAVVPVCASGAYHPVMGYRYVGCLETLDCGYWNYGKPCAAYDAALCTGAVTCTQWYECMNGQYCTEAGTCALMGGECSDYADCPEGYSCEFGYCRELGLSSPCMGLGYQCSGDGTLLMYCENGAFRLQEDCAAAGKVCKNIQCVEKP